MKKEDIIREVETMIGGLGFRGGYRVAKLIVKLSEAADGTWRSIGGKGRRAQKRQMVSAEAKRLVDEAKRRIQAADEGEEPLPKAEER